MRFLSANALWWLALGAVIIFFYLLKLKRTRLRVPSVLLWQRALEEMEANAPFRRLRRSLLLLLQLLALAAIVFALARPLVTTRALAAGSTVIIIDTTASMSARDESGRTRLDRARELALEMIDGLGSDDRAAVIDSSSRVTVRAAMTSDRAALRSAIGEVRETDAAGNLSDALRLAEQIAKAERDAGIVVIGDGGGPSVASDTTLNASLRFVRVGRTSDNVGIVAMNTRSIQAGARRELFASIANFGETNRDLSLELKIDGKLVDARRVAVDAGGRSSLIFDALPPSGGMAELKLIIEDDLVADDAAYAVVPDARRTRVGVASDNQFLLQALASNTELDARVISAGADASVFDCIISEGAVAADILKSAKPLFAINPPDLEGAWQRTGELERPLITSVDRSHPVNNYLSYADLHIESATARRLTSWLRPVVASGNDALISAGDDNGRRVVMMSFDPAQSDLPLKVEFPILLFNTINWLAGREASASDRAVRVGAPFAIQTSGPTVTVTMPDGETAEVAAREQTAVFADTLRAGVYQVSGSPSFAASLLSEAESDTAPRESIKTREGEISGEAETFYSEREWWRWIAMLALAALAAEWWVYHRRIS
ncbi:MAG TPA: BatA and WFA domain-containing protein [Blastocatellia bacterium]|nr:BatA and WFA domain-containing protein [Blastocatellia bacterium]